MIRAAALLALMPLAALAQAVPAPSGVTPPLRRDEPIPSYITSIPAARHQLDPEIMDAMRSALIVKMGGTPPAKPEAEDPKATSSGH